MVTLAVLIIVFQIITTTCTAIATITSQPQPIMSTIIFGFAPLYISCSLQHLSVHLTYSATITIQLRLFVHLMYSATFVCTPYIFCYVCLYTLCILLRLPVHLMHSATFTCTLHVFCYVCMHTS